MDERPRAATNFGTPYKVCANAIPRMMTFSASLGAMLRKSRTQQTHGTAQGRSTPTCQSPASPRRYPVHLHTVCRHAT